MRHGPVERDVIPASRACFHPSATPDVPPAEHIRNDNDQGSENVGAADVLPLGNEESQHAHESMKKRLLFEAQGNTVVAEGTNADCGTRCPVDLMPPPARH